MVDDVLRCWTPAQLIRSPGTLSKRPAQGLAVERVAGGRWRVVFRRSGEPDQVLAEDLTEQQAEAHVRQLQAQTQEAEDVAAAGGEEEAPEESHPAEEARPRRRGRPPGPRPKRPAA